MSSHAHPHAFGDFHSEKPDGLMLHSRRNFMKVGLQGIAGLSVPMLLRQRSEAVAAGRPSARKKSVILLWMAGGPSHIDTWDPKPDRPLQNRGPFGVINTRVPGVILCEHLPKQAAMFDKFTVIRSVDAQFSNHEPNKVFQTGNLRAETRTNPEAVHYPAIGSVVAKHHGPNDPAMPAYVAFTKGRSHIAFSGYLGRQYDPFLGADASRLPVVDLVGNDTGVMSQANLFNLPTGLTHATIHERRRLMERFDSLRSQFDHSGNMDAMDRYHQQAIDLLVGQKARDAFDLSREPAAIRNRYGKNVWCQQALLARRIVEAGASFVTIDLSYHTASGTWDTHGDNIPPYGGIKNGLGPLLPLFDHLLSTLVSDLDQRGMLEDVLVIAMGEFGRTPLIGTQDSTDGRNHWPVVMSMTLAGGSFQHGQVIGATERDGGHIKARAVTPGDLAATIYYHMGVPVDTHYLDPTGRPRPVVENGAPLRELM